MTRPLVWLRALVVRVVSARAMAHVVDPVIADTLFEVDEAIRVGRRFRARCLAVAGVLALFRTLVALAAGRLVTLARETSREEREALARALRTFAAVAGVGTILCATLPFVPLLNAVSDDAGDLVTLVGYLVPQALTLSIPVGLLVAALWGTSGHTYGRRVSVWLLCLSLVAAGAAWLLLASVTPAANQAFRAMVFDGPAMRGLNELTLGELRSLLDGGMRPADVLPFVRDGEVPLAYHGRLALVAAPPLFTMVGLALTSRMRRNAPLAFAGGSIATAYVAAQFFTAMSGVSGVPPAVQAWAPNAAVAALAVALHKCRAQVRLGDPPGPAPTTGPGAPIG